VNGYMVYDQASAQTRHLPSLIQEQSRLPQGRLTLADLRSGVASLAASLTAHEAAGAQLFVADAVTEEDLATLYAATRIALPHALFCGSAGLIGVIAAALVSEAGEDALPSAPLPPLKHPIVAVVGSGSRMAQRQLAYLRRHTPVECYAVDPQHPQPGDLLIGKEGQGDLVIHLPPPQADTQLEGEAARHYAAVLAEVAMQQVELRRPQTLLLVGGDTAIHFLQLLDIKQVQVQAELLPGMPLATGQSADGCLYEIILKAGNHGNEETLASLLGLLGVEDQMQQQLPPVCKE
jgi:D-threonate/D-erythronate kinase